MQICGVKLLAITDHGPEMADAPHYWHFVNMKVWLRVIGGVGVLCGIEANIQNVQGEIDCSGPTPGSIDIIVVGLHEPVFPPQDEATHTEAMIAAMASGLVPIISRPGNPNYPIDIKAVAEAAVKYDVAMELNNSSFTTSRKGSEANCRQVAQAVHEPGIRLRFSQRLYIR